MNDVEAKMNLERARDSAPDIFKTADLLIARALEAHCEAIDIIAYYGSYAQGTASAASDLDFFYIPAEGQKPAVGRTILVDGILFDFWAIGWDTLEGFATGRIRGWAFAPALVHHAKILHTRGEAQTARFKALQQKVLDLQAPEARPLMIGRALEAFKGVLAHLGNLRLAVAGGDFADVRAAGWEIILATWECLALANQVFFDRGWGGMLDQVSKLAFRPDDLEVATVLISTSGDPALIASSAEKLALGTRQVLRALQLSLPSQETAQGIFENGYPEIKDGLRKVLKACERGQAVPASAAAWSAQAGLSLMLNDLEHGSGSESFNLYSEVAQVYRQLGFPELMQTPVEDFAALAEQAGLLDQKVRQWLHENAVDLCEFENVEDLERSL